MDNKEFNGYRIKILKTTSPDKFFEEDVNNFLKNCGTFQLFTNVLGDYYIITIIY